MHRFWITLLMILPLILVACDRGTTTVERNPEGGIDITTTLTEQEVNNIIDDALAQGENPLLRDPQVDLQNGVIFVEGEHDLPQGGERVSGNMSISVTAQDGAILPQITEANIQGLDLSDSRFADLNQRLQTRFTTRADPENRLINVQSVTITEDNMTIVVNARRAE